MSSQLPEICKDAQIDYIAGQPELLKRCQQLREGKRNILGRGANRRSREKANATLQTLSIQKIRNNASPLLNSQGRPTGLTVREHREKYGTVKQQQNAFWAARQAQMEARRPAEEARMKAVQERYAAMEAATAAKEAANKAQRNLSHQQQLQKINNNTRRAKNNIRREINRTRRRIERNKKEREERRRSERAKEKERQRLKNQTRKITHAKLGNVSTTPYRGVNYSSSLPIRRN